MLKMSLHIVKQVRLACTLEALQYIQKTGTQGHIVQFTPEINASMKVSLHLSDSLL